MSAEISEPSRRPKDSSFFQQRLPAWQPMFSAKKSAITFLVMGIIFVPLGVVLLISSNSVIEYVIDYTDCKNSAGVTCSGMSSPNTECVCPLEVTIKSLIPGPVYLYYELANFHQNHRRYVRSKNDAQLLGTVQSPDSLSSCSPYSTFKNSTATYAILPCGAIANSIFNDTFTLKFQKNGASVPVPWTNEGIAWKSDVDRRYGTLSSEALKNTVKPPNWNLTIKERSLNPFKTDEELMVWMRVAALPNFRKLHRRITHSGDFKDGLPAGDYVMEVKYAFPVSSFNGRKSFVLGNVSWLGGKNITLGVTCLVTGSLHLLIGFIFLAIYLYTSRSKTRDRLPFNSPLLMRLTQQEILTIN